MTFGKGKKIRYISIHDICSAKSPVKTRALPGFHALTRCDNTSFFSGTGKKSAYLKWATRPELTTTFCHLKERSLTHPSEDIKVFESFVVSLYSATCPLTEVNKSRQQIFAQLSRTFEYLPPTKAALVEHIKRVTYQVGMYGSNLLWRNKPYQVLARGDELSQSMGGNLFGLPILKQQKHCKSWLDVGALKAVQENAPAIREV